MTTSLRKFIEALSLAVSLIIAQSSGCWAMETRKTIKTEPAELAVVAAAGGVAPSRNVGIHRRMMAKVNEFYVQSHAGTLTDEQKKTRARELIELMKELGTLDEQDSQSVYALKQVITEIVSHVRFANLLRFGSHIIQQVAELYEIHPTIQAFFSQLFNVRAVSVLAGEGNAAMVTPEQQSGLLDAFSDLPQGLDLRDLQENMALFSEEGRRFEDFLRGRFNQDLEQLMSDPDFRQIQIDGAASSLANLAFFKESVEFYLLIIQISLEAVEACQPVAGRTRSQR